MQLLHQLREDAGRLADEAAPEVLTAIEHLNIPGVIMPLFVSLVGRLEQDIPGLIHPTPELPASLTTHTPTDEEAENASAIPPQQPQQPQTQTPSILTPNQPAQDPQTQQPTVEDLQHELAQARQKIDALQSVLTPQQPAPPIVNQETQQ